MSRRVISVCAELALIVAVFALSAWITSLLVPMPFHVVNGHEYAGHDGERISRVVDRRFWVGWPVLLVCAVALDLGRRLLFLLIRRSRSAPA